MKSILLGITLAITLFSCNGNGDKKNTDSATDSTTTNHEAGVENVNGNIPDTTNSINLTHKLDTIGNKKKDSTK